MKRHHFLLYGDMLSIQHFFDIGDLDSGEPVPDHSGLVHDESALDENGQQECTNGNVNVLLWKRMALLQVAPYAVGCRDSQGLMQAKEELVERTAK